MFLQDLWKQSQTMITIWYHSNSINNIITLWPSPTSLANTRAESAHTNTHTLSHALCSSICSFHTAMFQKCKHSFEEGGAVQACVHRRVKVWGWSVCLFQLPSPWGEEWGFLNATDPLRLDWTVPAVGKTPELSATLNHLWLLCVSHRTHVWYGPLALLCNQRPFATCERGGSS